MKAVILAAGMGTRLGSLFPIPKPLTQLSKDRTVLDFQVEKLGRAIGVHNIYIVVGYKKEIIMEMHPQLTYIYNDRFAHTNTAKSLLMAVERLEDDILWLNGDVFFEDSLLELLTESDKSACLVNNAKVSDEEIKYTLKNGYIWELSKTVKNAKGEAVGINLIKRKDRKKFIEQLKLVEDKDYFEKALENLTTSQQIELKAINLGKKFCKEIDFEEDLKSVRAFISKSK